MGRNSYNALCTAEAQPKLIKNVARKFQTEMRERETRKSAKMQCLLPFWGRSAI